MSQLNPIHTPQANLPKIHSDPIFPPKPWSSKWSPSLGLSHQNLVHFFLPRVLHALPTSFALTCLVLPNDIYGWVQIMNFLIVPFNKTTKDDKQEILERTNPPTFFTI
jgi:hypothetical protein